MSTFHKIVRFFFVFLFLELFSGGSGQIFTLANIPMRQFFFIASFIFLVAHLIYRKKVIVDVIALNFILPILFWVFCSSAIGIVNGHDLVIIFKDVSPMLYFFLFFPIAYFVRLKVIDYELILSLLKFSSLFVSLALIIAYLVVAVFFSSNGYQLNIILLSTIGNEVFWFRPGGWVFYPGLFYVLVTNIILFERFVKNGFDSKYELVLFVLGFVAIIISMTKGLMLAFFLGMLIILVFSITSVKKVCGILFVLVLVSVFSLQFFEFSRLFNVSNDSGVINRVRVFHESIIEINKSPIIGNGFGTELLSKKQSQENSFIDIWVEQGVIGLFLYFSIFLVCFRNFRKFFGMKVALFSTLIMSFTNPYLNNPLGIGLIITLIALNYYSDNKEIPQ
jgi:O-antigen ligase